MKIANAEQMRALDREAIERYKIPGIVLMENAALGVVYAMEERYGSLRDRSVLILCGKGNNGGDGMAVARHLVNRGVHVRVFVLGDPETLRGDAAINHTICRQMKIPVRSVTSSKDLGSVAIYMKKADILLDALLGTGIEPPVRGLVEKVVQRINRSGKPVVAVDLPTGLSADSSKLEGEVVEAELTVTFGLPKISLVQYPSLSAAGKVRVVDISLPADLVEKADISLKLMGKEVLEALPKRKPEMHKGEAGRVLLVAGSKDMPGAAVMTALSAFRVGAGLIYAAVPEGVRGFLQKRLLEGVLVPLSKTNRKHLTMSALPDILKASRGKNVTALGPGIGLDPETGEMVRSLIQKIRIPVVLDADGINHVAEDPGVLKRAKAPVILTPHPGEMTRLTGATSLELKTRRVDLAREFAREFGVILILKGARSVIAEPKGQVWINSTGNPGMATAGTGDVLTGILAGLIAQGMPALQAALAGVYLHGRCGDRAAKRLGERSVLSRDLIREIPNVLQESHA